MSKIDFAMTDDGDLALGTPKLDENNNTLYYHDDGTIDTSQFKDGRAGKTVNDLAYTVGRNAWKQIIMNRLKTNAPEWYHHPKMGANLTDLIGEPNSRETGMLGAQYIANALTYDNFIDPMAINVRPVPISPEEITFFITVSIDDNQPYQLPIVFNLNHGLKDT